MNTLYYGDNLHVLRDHIKDESVDLIYLDPPFNSNRSYNILFKDESGKGADAQIAAFDDSWHWGETAERTYEDLIAHAPGNIPSMISSLRQFIGTNQMMAYLVMMAARLIELHRVLKPAGSLYLHCDPTASHYLKILLDTIFDFKNFHNEIIWKRTTAHSNVGKRFGIINDFLLFYTKTDRYTWNQLFAPYSEDHLENSYKYVEEKTGRKYASRDLTASMQRASSGQLYAWKGIRPPASRCWAFSQDQMRKLEEEGRIFYSSNGYPRLKVYLDEKEGIPLQNLWLDIPVISSQSSERLGFPTQKPLALLERIIQASSNPGDVVLDPFSGCGTCIAAAQKLGRQWIGIDITHLAIAMHKARLKDMFSLEPGRDYQVVGEPVDLASARQLAHDDRYQFQWWALSLVEAKPLGGEREGKKGSDRGIDGSINFIDDASKKLKRVIVQVKSGHVNSAHIRDLLGVLDNTQAQIGVFITLEPPTKEMETTAVAAGFYKSLFWEKDYPRIQVLTIEELLAGAQVKMPPNQPSFKQAEKVKPSQGEQEELGL